MLCYFCAVVLYSVSIVVLFSVSIVSIACILSLSQFKFILLVNRQSKIRLSRFYGSYDLKDRHRVQREVPALVLGRKSRQCNFIEYQGRVRESVRVCLYGYYCCCYCY